MKHVHYLSKGNSVGLDDDLNDYWEIDASGDFERSIRIHPDGTLLKYDRQHDADAYGVLPEGSVTEDDLSDASYGQISLITSLEFEAVWARNAKNRT